MSHRILVQAERDLPLYILPETTCHKTVGNKWYAEQVKAYFSGFQFLGSQQL